LPFSNRESIIVSNETISGETGIGRDRGGFPVVVWMCGPSRRDHATVSAAKGGKSMTLPAVGNLFAKGFVLLLGVLFLFPSSYKFFEYCRFRYQSVSVYGVVSHPMRGKGMGGKPFVSYKDRSGNVYEKRSEAKTHWLYAPQTGERVKVFYLENDPQVAMVDSTFHYILFPMFFSAIGAAAIVYAVKSIWQDSKKLPEG
jgi:hypothetical protein